MVKVQNTIETLLMRSNSHASCWEPRVLDREKKSKMQVSLNSVTLTGITNERKERSKIWMHPDGHTIFSEHSETKQDRSTLAKVIGIVEKNEKYDQMRCNYLHLRFKGKLIHGKTIFIHIFGGINIIEPKRNVIKWLGKHKACLFVSATNFMDN